MGEAQKKRRIGVGMKPRGEQRQRGPEGSSAGNERNEASTTEGQPESILDPVLNQMKQAETSSLATQETVQILDSEKAEKEASPLHSLNSEEEEVALNNALAESGPVVDAEFEEVEEAAPEDEPTAAEVAAIEPIRLKARSVGITTWATHSELGPQPNGTLKVAVTIEEGYASAVKEWAAADGLSLEEWLTNLVTANIETYAMPAKGR